MPVHSTAELLARLGVVRSTPGEQRAAVAAWLAENEPDPALVYDLTLAGCLPADWPLH